MEASSFTIDIQVGKDTVSVDVSSTYPMIWAPESDCANSKLTIGGQKTKIVTFKIEDSNYVWASDHKNIPKDPSEDPIPIFWNKGSFGPSQLVDSGIDTDTLKIQISALPQANLDNKVYSSGQFDLIVKNKTTNEVTPFDPQMEIDPTMD